MDYNFSVGTMVRLFKIMRLGASLHLPTYYRIEEAYVYDMVSEFMKRRMTFMMIFLPKDLSDIN